MKSLARAIIVIAAFMGGSPLAAQHAGHGGTQPTPAPARVATPAPVLFTPQESAGAVTLLMAPRWAGGRLTMLVSATTHDGDLASVDLATAVVLQVAGQAIAPASATMLRGHHARATVVFPLADRPERFALEIRGVPDVEVRTLAWPVPVATAPAARR